MKPQTVIFSSSSSFHVAQGLHLNLTKKFQVHLWKGDFFGKNTTTPLWTFFKNLFNYDYAILILSDDNIIRDDVTGNEDKWVPKDNVIFELGATMARLGPQKTILVVPDFPTIHLPGYFDDVMPHKFYYPNPQTKTIEDSLTATKSAAEGIAEILENVDFRSFHAELPAQGLAHAYYANFLAPVTRIDKDQRFDINGKTLDWTVNSGVIATVVMPEHIMERGEVNLFFENLPGCHNINIQTFGGRNLSVYALERSKVTDPLHILDIPTTLSTAGEIVERIEEFWREKDSIKVPERDAVFTEELKKREILNFSRSLEKKVSGPDSKIFVIPITALSEHLADYRK